MRHEQQDVPRAAMKTYYVMVSGGSFKDRYEVKVKASSPEAATKIAYEQERYGVCGIREAYHVPDKKEIRIIKRCRKQGFKWTEIAWHLGISVPTVKKYFKRKV